FRRKRDAMSGLELDLAVLRRRLHHLAVTATRLDEYRDAPLDRLESEDGTDWVVLHGLQLCIQAVLDITAHIVAASGASVPDTYRDGIGALERLGVLPADFVDQIADMAGFLNILV